MARIPMAGDVAELIGNYAQEVQNRSLLLDKFAFHKQWGLDGLKAPDAHRWTLLRMSDGGAGVLNMEADRRSGESKRPNVEEHNRDRLKNESELAAQLARTKVEAGDAQELRQQHTRRFLELFRSAYRERASVTIAQLEGRLAINLSDGLIQNAGICLDRLFGLPFIPGSAVKGVCRHGAMEELREAAAAARPALFDAFRRVFGTADNDFANGPLKDYRSLLAGRSENQKGAISFLPAYPFSTAKVVVDLTNVHYPDYYRSGRLEDLGNERPQPNPFPTVESGAQFAFCMVLNGIDDDPELLQRARIWLEKALTVHGLGAKTAAGHGWFSLQPQLLAQLDEAERHRTAALAEKARKEAEAKAKAEEEVLRLAAMKPEDRARDKFKAMTAEEFVQAATGLAAMAPEEQRGFLMVLLTPERKDAWKTWKKSDKPTSKARVAAILAAAKAHNIGIT